MTATTPLDPLLRIALAPWVELDNLQQLERSVQHITLKLSLAPLLLQHPEHYAHSLHALAGSAMSCLVEGALQPGFSQRNVALHASLIHPEPCQHLQIEARVCRQGRSVSFAEASVFSADGTVLAHYQGTFALFNSAE